MSMRGGSRIRKVCRRRKAVQAILGLESDWQGPLRENREIPKTLRLLESLETNAMPEQRRGNWRWESLLYRGYYDA